MPRYTYKCQTCETYFEDVLSIEDRHKPTESNCGYCGASEGSISQVIEAPRLVDPIRLHGKLPSGYTDLMKKIQGANPGSKVYDNMKYPSKAPEQ